MFPYLIPSNFFAAKSLRQLAELSQKVTFNMSLATRCTELAEEVEKALQEYAVIEHLHYGKVLAYEVDGMGNRLMMDDSNVPSLLSLPYLGCTDANNNIYTNTRKFLLSKDNPWYFEGNLASGIGSPHTLQGNIWPMTIIMRALTSPDVNEIKLCLNMLKATHSGKGFMHESFNKDKPDTYTRDWFAWANTLFGELIIKVYQEHPEILRAE